LTKRRVAGDTLGGFHVEVWLVEQAQAELIPQQPPH